MTSMRPCKVIRYENCCLNKRSPNYHVFRPAGYHSFKPKTNSSKPHSASDMEAGAEFDGQLLALEKYARCQYLKKLESLTFGRLPRWLDQMLDRNLLPTLHRIGFDEQISKVLFKIAQSSWRLMGPLNEKSVTFHPVINQQIEEVRHKLELKASKNGNMIPCCTGEIPQIISGTIKDDASPENLFDLLDEITTPWIILPRAFRFLKKRQCCYLPVYLKTIDREVEESCLKLFSRIAVEFVGNYTLKFAERRHPPDQLAKLLFYGYAALFWKTLRCPPENLENSAAFDSFYKWICRLIRKNDFFGPEETALISHMTKMKSMIFPAKIFSYPQISARPGLSPFMVTLRHGSMGIVTLLKYFGVDQFLETRQIGDRFARQSVEDEVHGLLQIIQAKYHLESNQTREYIKLFIGYLQSAYARILPSVHQIEKDFLNRKFNNLQIILGK